MSSRRRRALRSTVLVALALGVALVVGACSGSEEPAATTAPPPAPVVDVPRDGGTLRVASGPLPVDWSPAAGVWDASAQQVARGLYDRLAAYDDNNLPRPELAESITPDPTFTRWTIRLRRGILFQDGTPFDADAVVANLDAQRASPVGLHLLASVVAVTRVDSRTVVIAMSTPWATFADTLTSQVGVMASPGTLVATGTVAPIGTGAFRYAERLASSPTSAGASTETGGLLLERNPLYWRSALPRLDAVRFTEIAEPGLRVSAVLAGQADLVAADRPAQLLRLDQAAAAGAVRLVEDRNAEAPKAVIALNTARAPFDSITARRAAALATDRRELDAKSLQGQGTMARGIISDPSPWYTDLPEPVPDTNRARSEVASFETEFGVPIASELLVPDDPYLRYVAALWRGQQAEVGIEITIRPVDAAELADLTANGQYQAAMLVGFTSPHPDRYQSLLGGIPGEQPAVNVNITRYVNPVVTQSFADARATTDPALQVDAYRIVQEQLFLDLPWLFLLQLRQAVALSPQVRDVTDWTMASGDRGIGQEGATVSLSQIWLDPADGSTPGSEPDESSLDDPGTDDTVPG